MAATANVSLYNTATRSVEPFVPLEPGKVRMYCCGPTVYNYQHIGNLRTYIFEDVLLRALQRAGFDVYHVMNITDVGHLVSDADEGEDKMVIAAQREKKRSHEIAEFYTNAFLEDCTRLSIKRPTVVCKATDHIKEMIELIQRLEARGLTYTSGGNVYFDIAKFPRYGDLARLDLEALQAGARIDIDQEKRNPLDFVLWFTKSKFEGQELLWDSPWGIGYPGWHIECSAMSMRYLGDRFDIHCGGIDHIPVHHTNEIAQSEGATGQPWVRYWMHGEFLVLGQDKMSKSKGNFLRLQDAIDRGLDPLAYRYFCLGAHYRSQLMFSWEALEGSHRGLQKLQEKVRETKEAWGGGTLPELSRDHPAIAEFNQALFNDLNTSKALAAAWTVLGNDGLSGGEKLAILFSFDEVLGLRLAEAAEKKIEIPQAAIDLLAERNAARKEKNFKRADEIRDQLTALGFAVVDDPKGSFLRLL